MFHLLRFRSFRKISKLDAVIRPALDKILPRNLTVGYIAALTVVATLAVIGQFSIQTTLSQGRVYKKLGMVKSVQVSTHPYD